MQTSRWGAPTLLRPLGSLGELRPPYQRASGMRHHRADRIGGSTALGRPLRAMVEPQSHREELFGDPDPDTAIIDAEFARDVGESCDVSLHYTLRSPRVRRGVLYMSGLYPIAPERSYRGIVWKASSVIEVVGVLVGAYADRDEIATAEVATTSETAVRMGSCLNLWINRVSLCVNPSLCLTVEISGFG